MAARHFAQSVPSFEEEDNEVEETSRSVSNMGRHARRPVLEYVSAPISSFAVEVPADDDADARARARIEQILLELEASLMRPAESVKEPEPEIEAELEAKPEPGAEPEPVVPKPEAEPEPVEEAESEHAASPEGSLGADDASALESLPELEPAEPKPADSKAADSDSGENNTFWSKAEANEDASVSNDAAQFAHDVDEATSESNPDDELDTTAVLDHEAIRKAIQEQEDAEEEEVVHVERHERLEVGSGFYVPPNNSTSEIGTELATRKPRLSFFARIGEAIARLFHMDD